MGLSSRLGEADSVFPSSLELGFHNFVASLIYYSNGICFHTRACPKLSFQFMKSIICTVHVLVPSDKNDSLLYHVQLFFKRALRKFQLDYAPPPLTLLVPLSSQELNAGLSLLWCDLHYMVEILL
jgi:hypothetical protein